MAPAVATPNACEPTGYRCPLHCQAAGDCGPHSRHLLAANCLLHKHKHDQLATYTSLAAVRLQRQCCSLLHSYCRSGHIKKLRSMPNLAKRALKQGRFVLLQRHPAFSCRLPGPL
jgi:hypothetical protein